MARNQKHYDTDYKVQSVNLAKEIKLKKMVWRYFMSYWNNRRIGSSNDGLPPKVKRDRYYAALPMVA